jgi:hypothetical protein
MLGQISDVIHVESNKIGRDGSGKVPHDGI